MTVTTRALPVVLALFSVAALGACRKAPAPPPAPVEDTAAIRRAREDSIRQAEAAREAAERILSALKMGAPSPHLASRD